MNDYILYLLGAFPIPSETFIFREVEIISRLIPLRVIAFRKGNHASIEDPSGIFSQTIFPPGALVLVYIFIRCIFFHPIHSVKITLRIVFYPHTRKKSRSKLLKKTLKIFWLYDSIKNNLPKIIHAHYLDWQTEAAMIVAEVLNIKFSASGHANDIYVKANALKEKIEKALFITTCTRFNYNHLLSIVPHATNIYLNYHGVPHHRLQDLLGNKKVNPSLSVFISAGRLVPKKGFDYLIKACFILKNERILFQCQIIGSGPLEIELQSLIHELALQNHIHLLGTLPNKQVIELIRDSTVFVLPCIQAANGDIDGIPNVIVESMYMKTPVVSTNISGIPEIVKNDVTGLLCEQKNAVELATKMKELHTHPDLREALAEKAFCFANEHFDMEKNVCDLSNIFKKFLCDLR